MSNTKHVELPRGWEKLAFTKFCDLKHGFQFREEHFTNSGIPIIKIGNLIDGAGIREDNLTFIDTKLEDNFESVKLKEGDILMALTGGTLGKICVFPKRNNTYLQNYRVGNFLPKKNADKEFVFQVLQSYMVQDRIKNLVNEAAQPNFGKQDFDKIKIPLPPLPEQRAIANILSTWDTAIQTTQALISQKEQDKKWLMQNLLTGKKRLKGFSGEWKEYSYENILKVVKRNFEWDENELYKLISVRRRSGGIFYREALYGHQILVKTLRTAQEGDFLFSKMQILHGASALVTKEFDGAKISGSYIAVVSKEKNLLNMEFFQWYSKTPHFYHQSYVSSYGVHIEKMTFDFQSFLQLEIKLPSFEEQAAINQVLQTADKEIELLKTKLEQQKLQKKGLMQVLLTGKVRVKN